MENLLVSACLIGLNVKYNGMNNYNPKIVELMKYYNLIPICPEFEGGLSIPRVPSEIKENRVINKDGIDLTENFTIGANKALIKAREFSCAKALLKEKSPSCGKVRYDGSFTGKIISKSGITANLLQENNIEVYSEEEIDKLINLKK